MIGFGCCLSFSLKNAVLAEYKTNVNVMNKNYELIKSRRFEMYRTSRVHCSNSDNSMRYLCLICWKHRGKKIINWKMEDKKNAIYAFVNVFKLGKNKSYATDEAVYQCSVYFQHYHWLVCALIHTKNWIRISLSVRSKHLHRFTALTTEMPLLASNNNDMEFFFEVSIIVSYVDTVKIK